MREWTNLTRKAIEELQIVVARLKAKLGEYYQLLSSNNHEK